MNNDIKIGNSIINKKTPAYFIADIAANHDGNLDRAKKLIELAKSCGTNAVKFQHHDVGKYVSDFGFRELGNKFSHQSAWKKSIFEVYKDAEVPLDWTEELMGFCKDLDVDFLSTPYDLDMVDLLGDYVSAYKIGSGDLAWDAMIQKVAKTSKPVLLATGAGTIAEVQNAMDILSRLNNKVVLMQCNTNYTGDESNLKYIHLNVLKTYKVMYPDVIIGLSDHTKGHVTVLGAVALGAKVIEKHFTDDCNREGPDHPFSMDPKSWREMVDATRHLELALGHGTKEVQENEKETVILQRRAIRATEDVFAGDTLDKGKFQFQRPRPKEAISINEIENIVGKKIKINIVKGDYLRKEHIDW